MKTIISIFLLLLSLSFFAQTSRAEKVLSEGQPIADQNNGYYKNPIFPGNYGDPSIVRVGEDYYMAFSRSNGIIIWHSKDLVNWQPKFRHRLPEGYDTVWAIDLQYFNDMFHIYMPIREFPGKGEDEPFGNFVIRSKNPEGPWSDPINLEIKTPTTDYYSGIDPGFIQTPDGEKYLYVNHGWAMKLNDEGTKAVSDPKIVYKGWDYPKEWAVECHCLESPKLFYKDGFYYMVSAEGGTSGPSTAHMSVVARAKHPLGPWENSPHNPLTHTYSQDEAFWHQGHGTIFEDKDGNWWTVYHGRVKDFTEMGRPTLLMPIKWTEDGWPIEKGFASNALIPKPKGDNVGHGLPYSDDFESTIPGNQWYFDNAKKDLLQFGGGKLTITAMGETYKEANQVSAYAPNKSYSITVRLEGVSKSNISGIKMGNNGIVYDGKNVFFMDAPDWRQKHSVYTVNSKNIWLKIVNFRKDLSFFYSTDGVTWNKFADSIRSHDSYQYSLFAFGEGKTLFKNFEYQGFE